MQKGVRTLVHWRNSHLCPQQSIFSITPYGQTPPQVVPTQPSLQFCFHLFPFIVSCLRDVCRAENRSFPGQQFLLYFRSLGSLKRLHAWGSERIGICMCVWEREALKATRGVKERFSPECDWLLAPLSRGTLSPWRQDVAGSQWNDSEVAQEGSQPPGRTVPVEVPDYIPTITRVGIRRERLPAPNHCNDLNCWPSRIIMWSGGGEKEESPFKNVSWAWKIIFQVKKELWYLHVILMEI